MSKEQITTTPLHFDFHNISHLGWVLLVAVGLCLIFVFVLNVVKRETDFAYSRGEFIFSMGVLLMVAFSILFCMLTPISVTQRTSIRTQTFQILEKRSTSRDLEFLVKDHENVVSVKKTDLKSGDIVAFWQGNKLLVKRVIAGPGQWVDIDVNGNVSVDGKALDEKYLN